MNIYINIYISIYIYICIYIHIHKYSFTFIYIFICLYILCTYVRKYVYFYAFAYTYPYVLVCVHVHVYIVCKHICTSVYVGMYPTRNSDVTSVCSGESRKQTDYAITRPAHTKKFSKDFIRNCTQLRRTWKWCSRTCICATMCEHACT